MRDDGQCVRIVRGVWYGSVWSALFVFIQWYFSSSASHTNEKPVYRVWNAWIVPPGRYFLGDPLLLLNETVRLTIPEYQRCLLQVRFTDEQTDPALCGHDDEGGGCPDDKSVVPVDTDGVLYALAEGVLGVVPIRWLDPRRRQFVSNVGRYWSTTAPARVEWDGGRRRLVIGVETPAAITITVEREM